ncbi:MAG: hypothetical protein Fues2KO_14300 [Fuerstiella sp.]
MLVLARKVNQRIRIGEDTWITVVRGENVRLGIDAPRHVEVVREEVLDRRHDVPADASHVPQFAGVTS